MKKKSLIRKAFSIAYNVLLIVLGIIAIVSPDLFQNYVGLISGIFVLLIAVCLIVIGILTFSVSFSGYFLLIGGFLSFGVGLFFVAYPGVGMTLVTMILGFLFLFSGISKIVYSLRLRQFHIGGYSYNLIVGILYIILFIFMDFFAGSFNDIISLILGILLLIAGSAGIVQIFLPEKGKEKEAKIVTKAREDSEHIDIDFTTKE